MDIVVDFFLWLKYLALGLIQGVTEPIPISSSGHIILLQHFFDIEIEGLSFEVFVNFASLLAVLLIYRRDILNLANDGIRYTLSREKRYQSGFYFIVFLVIGTIPAGVIGVLYGDYISEHLKHIKVIGAALLMTGIALWLIRNLRGKKNDGQLTFVDAIIVGLAQAVALIPGISRSGATIIAAMGLGMRQETALKFSFLLYIPVSLGSGILAIGDIINDPNLMSMLVPYLLAFLASFVATYFSLKWFMNIMAKGNLIYFSIYCFIVGALVILFVG